jgi:hypothetical protein
MWAKVAIVAASAIGGFGVGWHRASIKGERAEAAWKASYDAQLAETARVTREWGNAGAREHEWKIKALAAGNDAAAVARQLREHRARRCAVPAAAAAAGESGSPGAQPGDIGGAEEAHYRACALDAVDYDAMRAFYNRLRAVQ